MAAVPATLARRAPAATDPRPLPDETRPAAVLTAPAGRRRDAGSVERPPQRSERRSRVRLRFLRFALIGLGNTAVTFAVFNLCLALLHLPAAAANVIGWVAGFANSFAWNRAWTFADRRHLRVGRVLPRFALVSLAALGVSEAVLVGLHSALLSSRLVDLLPRTLLLNGIELAAIGCSLGVSYALSACWAFRKA
jgi:putative flippase GtrA